MRRMEDREGRGLLDKSVVTRGKERKGCCKQDYVGIGREPRPMLCL